MSYNMIPYRDAIAKIESDGSGGYAALGPRTDSGDRAYGRYQVMGANIPQWSQAAVGRAVSPQEFIENPQIQDAIFDNRFGSYLANHSPQDAASMWFTGRPLAQGGNSSDVLGTTGNSYVGKFNDALGQVGSSADTPAPQALSAPATAPASGILTQPVQDPSQADPAMNGQLSPTAGLLAQQDTQSQPDPFGSVPAMHPRGLLQSKRVQILTRKR